MSTNTKSYHQEPLVNQLNTLLVALQIPIPITSPIELTPSLLIAILSRFSDQDIPEEFSPLGHANRNVQSMKFFLGVLESDIIQQDVGLRNVDPRKLATGQLYETTYVGELLCWLGRDRGLIVEGDNGASDEVVAYHDGAPSPTMSALSFMTKKTTSTSNFSLHGHSESNTSVSFSVGSVDTFQPTHPNRKRPRQPQTRTHPRCIHEIPSPSIILSPELNKSFVEQSYCTCAGPSSPKPAAQVRYTGYIEPVDEDLELRSFESMGRVGRVEKRSSGDIDDHQFDFLQLREARARTVALLDERARLLEELAKLDYPP